MKRDKIEKMVLWLSYALLVVVAFYLLQIIMVDVELIKTK